VTGRPAIRPPRAIAIPHATSAVDLSIAGTTSRRAAILGVSFTPRAKLIAPADSQCRCCSAESTRKPSTRPL